MLSKPKILVATDFSETSDLALRAAEEIRSRSRGSIHVVHVSAFPEQWEWFTNDVVLNYNLGDQRKKLLEAIEKRLKTQIERSGIKAQNQEILMGPAARMILEFSEENSFDLIVLGHRGEGSFLHLGDVAGKIVSAAKIPVLVVNRDFEIGRVAGLVDPLEPEEKVFSATEELAFLSESDVEFISLWPDQSVYAEGFPEVGISVVEMTEEKKNEVRDRMEKLIRQKMDPHSGAKVRADISPDEKIRDGLVTVLEEEKVDLAVMGRHQKGKIEKLLLGSTTRGILDHWDGNLLVLPT